MHLRMLLNLLFLLAEDEHSERASKNEFESHVHLDIYFPTGISSRETGEDTLDSSQALRALPISFGNFFAKCPGIWCMMFQDPEEALES